MGAVDTVPFTRFPECSSPPARKNLDENFSEFVPVKAYLTPYQGCPFKPIINHVSMTNHLLEVVINLAVQSFVCPRAEGPSDIAAALALTVALTIQVFKHLLGLRLLSSCD